jgi:hypothetical protein
MSGWKIQQDDLGYYVISDTGEIVAHSKDREQAHLIAAAPEMLKILKTLSIDAMSVLVPAIEEIINKIEASK